MRSTDPAAAHSTTPAAAVSARAVVEQLEMLWERGREAVPTAPVSTSQLRVLYILDKGDGLNLRTLGEQLGAAPSSVSRLCDRLQALGYLERAYSDTDRREVLLRLTSPGRTYLSELRGHREAALAATLAAMAPQDQEALARGLDAFRRANDGAPGGAPPHTHRSRSGGSRSRRTESPPGIAEIQNVRVQIGRPA
ncbi:MarR family winged helix-turn-helix transcriptional regulator [Streptomyces sp. NPDC058657]|uniref:MarR family winged helix-turn-helix transcriptional regulator n=1 Tax=unclassified Streptomyces TaxID=2593676 RepID=UPI003658BD32